MLCRARIHYVFSFRTIESLLTMAEVDIICDASQQAHAKLNGAEALLAATGALSEATRVPCSKAHE